MAGETGKTGRAGAKDDWAICEISEKAGPVSARCPKRILDRLMECDPRDVAGRREAGQSVLDMLCLTSRISVLPLTVSLRPGRDEKGEYEFDEKTGFGKGITVNDRPGGLTRPVSNLEFLKTLCHEFCHHYDIQALRLGKTFHTAGFYRRCDGLFRKLSSGGL